jgi:hypothetical protein
MTERVVSANRNHREPRLDGVDEPESRSVARSVVTDLDGICVEVVAGREQPCFICLASVTHEKLAEATRAQYRDIERHPVA